jgi:hypothetical protein
MTRAELPVLNARLHLNLLEENALTNDLIVWVSRSIGSEVPADVHTLFRRAFGHPAPNFGHHFFCFAKEGMGEKKLLAYGHCTPKANYYLGGGMCSDLRQLRSLSVESRRALDTVGGAACLLVQGVFQWCVDKPAVFGHVGHRVAREIDLQAGFEATHYPHLMVHWTNPEHRPAHLVDEAHAEGAF